MTAKPDNTAAARFKEIAPLGEGDFQRLRAMIYAVAGINMPSTKRILVANRLAKRLRARQLSSYAEYLKLIEQDAVERAMAIDLLTTNETYFFREPRHFDFIRERVIPGLTRDARLRAWSAVCSSGEEAYSLAMLLDDQLGARRWQVTGSDLSGRMIERACSGHYPLERAERIPTAYLRRYCQRGTGQYAGTFQHQVEPANDDKDEIY